MHTVPPAPEGAKLRLVGPPPEPAPLEALEPAEPRISDDVDALGVRSLCDADVDHLEKLSLAELYASAFDLLENDLAESVLSSAADMFAAIHAAMKSDLPPSGPAMERLMFRTTTLIRVGIELHRRQRAAAFARRK